jgi:galactokinase
VREVAREARRAFAEHFGREAAWGAAAPGRVNLIGEHTDYNAGFVLPMAIDRWCVVVAGPARSGDSRLRAHDLGQEISISLRRLARSGAAERPPLPAWAAYVVGALVEHGATLGIDDRPEFDLLVTSTVPRGGGLSSSAALETASTAVLELASGRSAEPVARALACQRAEHRWAGVPCGLMDQLASSCGVEGHALRIDCRENSVTPVPLPPETDAVVLVVNSGVHHELAAGEYAKRRRSCEAAAAGLGVGSLRDLEAMHAVDWSRLDEEQARCVRHVVSENGRVLAAVDALRVGDLAALGRLMLESHASLRDDYRVSCGELDVIVDIAAATPGVFGARMTGGGFGGCAVVLASPTAAATLTEHLPPAYARATGRPCKLEKVAAVSGAHGWTPAR